MRLPVKFKAKKDLAESEYEELRNEFLGLKAQLEILRDTLSEKNEAKEKPRKKKKEE